MIEICVLIFGAMLLLGSIGAFLLYIPFLNIAVCVVILVGMALTFLIGAWVGSTRRLRLSKHRLRQSRLRRDVAEKHAATSAALQLGDNEKKVASA